jgi:septal ring factor EnvC (AmiA/AmiB activator)
VQRVLPEVVQKTPEGLLAVNYVEIIPVLIEAFKQHLTDYQDIKDKVADMLDRQNRQTEQVLAELVSLKDEIHTVHQKVRCFSA